MTRRELEEPLPGWSDAKYIVQVKPEDNEEIGVLLHKLWSRDTGGPDYDKTEWTRLLDTLNRFGYRI